MIGIAALHHVEFNVANASQAAFWFCSAMGFKRFARRETEKEISIVVRNNDANFVFTTKLKYSKEERRYYTLHGDCVRDVAFSVDDLDGITEALETENVEIRQPAKEYWDKYGTVTMATVRSQETEVLHSLIEKGSYKGCFLPGFERISDFPISKILEPLPIIKIDHVVQACPEETVENTAEWYKKSLALNRFWSADDYIAKTEKTAITAWLLVNKNKNVQYTLAETVRGRPGRSQIQEFIDYNGGSGIQHIALLVTNIVAAVVAMKNRGVEFLTVPDAYYEILRERLSRSKLDFSEDVETLKRHRVLMDFDDNGYLLQIFTKPIQDKPTLFFEIIQRKNFNGFGAGNFKSLFEAVEREQKLRGTL